MPNQSQSRSLLEIEIITTREEIFRLMKANETLDWEIPSQYDQKLRNLDTINLLESRISIRKEQLEREKRLAPNPFDSFAKAAVTHIFSKAPMNPIPVRHLRLVSGNKEGV